MGERGSLHDLFGPEEMAELSAKNSKETISGPEELKSYLEKTIKFLKINPFAQDATSKIEKLRLNSKELQAIDKTLELDLRGDLTEDEEKRLEKLKAMLGQVK